MSNITDIKMAVFPYMSPCIQSTASSNVGNSHQPSTCHQGNYKQMAKAGLLIIFIECILTFLRRSVYDGGVLLIKHNLRSAVLINVIYYSI